MRQTFIGSKSSTAAPGTGTAASTCRRLAAASLQLGIVSMKVIVDKTDISARSSTVGRSHWKR